MATVTRFRPSDLRYTHDSVSSSFSNGCGLKETFEQILYDEVSVSAFPPLVAMYHRGEWFVVRGNRRLYIWKHLESAGKISKVNVECVDFEYNLFTRQYSTDNAGQSLRIRGNPIMEQSLQRIVRTWEHSNGRRRQIVYESALNSYRNDYSSYPSSVRYNTYRPQSATRVHSWNTPSYSTRESLASYSTRESPERSDCLSCCCRCLLVALLLTVGVVGFASYSLTR